MTYEFENVPLAAVDAVAPLAPVRPGRRALEVAQDRLAEKDFLRGIGLATAPYAAGRRARGARRGAGAARRAGDPEDAAARLRRQGAGADRRSGATAAAAWAAVGGAPSVLEGFVGFEREISVIAARGLDGAVAAFDPGENEHRDGILHRTRVPARVPPAVAQDAVLIAGRILNALDYVGVIGVEMFVTPGGARGQRDRAAGAQLRALDRGGLPDRPVRAAHPRDLRLAARRRARGIRTRRW